MLSYTWLVHALAGIVLVLLSFAVAARQEECKGLRVRKEIRDLTIDELNRYIHAVKTIYRRGVIDHFTMNHFVSGANVHGAPMFFVWHRNFIWEYENLLREIDPTLTLPYWDWTLDAADPRMSQVFHRNYMGSTGVESDFDCLRDGPFRDWQATMTVPHCLQRRFNMTQFWGPDLLLAVQRRAASYNDLRLMIEGTIHATVHLTIGGDFAQLTSTNDPIFYPHHAMIDKIWYDWQFMGNGDERFSDYNGVDTVRTNVNVQLSDPIPESSLYRVRDVMHPRRSHLCYTYAESRARKAASALLDRYGSGDPPKSINQTIEIIATALGYDPTLIDLRVLSGNETNIKGRESNPEWWNVMNNLKADEVNLLYGNAQAILKELSSLPYYVSPSAVQLAYIKSHSPQNPPYEIWEADTDLMSTGTNNNNVSVSIITAPPTGFIIIENLAMSSPALDSHASIENKDGGIFVKVPQPTFQ